MGDLSRNFSRSEFRCRHCGRLPEHGIDPQLVLCLQRLRDRLGRPVAIVSGYRCADHPLTQQRPGSMHHQGRAADLPEGSVTVVAARAAGFSGIGRRGRWAVHVDVRWQLHVTDWEYA